MAQSPQPSSIHQTAGNDNIQVAGSHNVITRITNFFAGDTEQQRSVRHRRAMLQLVKNIWLKGVLERSLHNEVLIKLGLEERPGAVDHPWDMQVQMPSMENRSLPSGTSMIEIFDEMNGAMLILGEPGAGKTTMLLELAGDCIDRAMQDDNQPIPVVFNLSSWDGGQTIDDWLINELEIKYNVPGKTAQGWVLNDELRLLLDGLDEVKLQDRELCVRAINVFRQRHGMTVSMAICSRVADYEALTSKLSLPGAVLLQPLTPEQIDNYFDQMGPQFEKIRQILKRDETLQEMAKQPLLLSILTLAYQGWLIKRFEGEEQGTIEARRKQLFDTYIRQMFSRSVRTKNEAFDPTQTERWLGWLARGMIWNGQSSFSLEQLDLVVAPDVRIRLRAIIGLSFFVPVGYWLGSIWNPIVGLSLVAIIVLITLMTFRGAVLEWQDESERLVKEYKEFIGFSAWKSWPGLLLGYVIGDYFVGTPYAGVIFALSYGLAWGTIVTRDFEFHRMGNLTRIHHLFERLTLKKIEKPVIRFAAKLGWIISNESRFEKLAEKLRWSWRKALHGVVVGMSLGFAAGILAGLIGGFVSAHLLQDLPEYDYQTAFLQGLGSVAYGSIFMILLGLLGGLIYGLSVTDLDTRIVPNLGIRRSIKSALVVVMISALMWAMVGAVVGASLGNIFLPLPYGVLIMIGMGFVLGLIMGLPFSLYYGGYAVIYHYSLRLILYHSGNMPRNYIRFLDYCVDRIFLRRVGGGYIFVHRLLMEHFAAIYRADEK